MSNESNKNLIDFIQNLQEQGHEVKFFNSDGKIEIQFNFRAGLVASPVVAEDSDQTFCGMEAVAAYLALSDFTIPAINRHREIYNSAYSDAQEAVEEFISEHPSAYVMRGVMHDDDTDSQLILSSYSIYQLSRFGLLVESSNEE